MNKFYLSLEKSKQLKEWGCDLPFTAGYEEDLTSDFVKRESYLTVTDFENNKHNLIPSYNILEDICCKYAKEFFGEKDLLKMLERTCWILYKLQQKEKQEAEEYFMEHTIFNPKNK